MDVLTDADRRLLRWLGNAPGPVTAAEAAVGTGLVPAEAERRLLGLVDHLRGDLRVAQDGTVAYCLPRRPRQLLLARFWQLRLQEALMALLLRLSGLVRMGFGLLLLGLTSLVVLALLVLAALPLLRSDDGLKALLHLALESLELLVRALTALLSGGRPRGRGRRPAPPRLRFLEVAFSILFGDGDPNRRREERRWRSLGRVLQASGGVAIAEDLAPLLDLPAPAADPAEAGAMADRAMLPVLLRFDGRPRVSERGELIYWFPALQVSSGASEPPPPQRRTVPAPALRERPLRFSRARRGQVLGYGLATGSLLLLSPLLGVLAPASAPPLLALAWVGAGYGLLLAVLPLVRLQLLRGHNRRIAQRNRRRRLWAAHASRQAATLECKRRAARRLARRHRLGASGLAYSTETDLLVQQIKAAPGDGGS